MPAWGPQLGLERVQAVVAYVLTLKDTNVPGGKAPQGTAALE
jgi:cytochrome c oxidase cbb3-type subunit 3